MEATDSNSQLGYGKPPWIFRGSALYQLHLVKAKTARSFIPKEFKLVEAFGYTLGGFFLANYDDSPAGTFDELVVIAGTVWNPPTSCAWAARVLVNSDKACVHGREEVGLPSEVASFKKRAVALPMRKKSQFHDFLHKSGTFDSSSPENGIDIHVEEISNNIAMDICSIRLNASASQDNSKKWLNPEIKMSLPSFSGRTEYNPHLLKYSCQMTCRVRMVPWVKVQGPSESDEQGEVSSDNEGSEYDPSSKNRRKLMISVLLSKPILALEFKCLKMKVEAPTIVHQ